MILHDYITTKFYLLQLCQQSMHEESLLHKVKVGETISYVVIHSYYESVNKNFPSVSLIQFYNKQKE